MNKKEIRREILAKRKNMDQESKKQYDIQIMEALFATEEFQKAKCIFAFVSYMDEVDTHALIQKALAMGKRIFIPYIVSKKEPMKVSELRDFKKELELGHYDILALKKEYLNFPDPNEIDLILTPGVAFDELGYRVGYGGGYYDRFFSSLKKDVVKIGICYEVQMIPKVPTDQYDLPVDFILTEKGLKKTKTISG